MVPIASRTTSSAARWLPLAVGRSRKTPRSITEGKPPPRALAEDGAGATEMLLSDPALLAAVQPWYAALGRTLTSSVQEATARLQLNPRDAGFEVDLVDAGSGMGQVLPVLTALAMARASARAREDVLLAIEEPESQLHPNAQRELGAWLCDAAAVDPAPHLVLETHSRILILAVQVAIATDRLDPARVAVYWLDQRSDGSTSWDMVEFDRAGRPGTGWPRDIFADELELADILSAKQFADHAWGA
jgi:predicted ATPase